MRDKELKMKGFINIVITICFVVIIVKVAVEALVWLFCFGKEIGYKIISIINEKKASA
jgi:hypothetical protein